MTAQGMIDNFFLEYDLNGSGAVAGFTDNEVLSFLNKAQLEIAEEVFLRHGADQIYSVNSVETDVLDTPAAGYYNQNELSHDLPTDYMYFISMSAVVSRSGTKEMAQQWIMCTPIKTKNADKFLTSTIDFQILINPVCFVRGDKIILIKDSSTTIGNSGANDDYVLKYAKIPTAIELGTPDVDSEMSEKWHQDIVDAAVVIAMKVTNDPRIRQKRVELSKGE